MKLLSMSDIKRTYFYVAEVKVSWYDRGAERRRSRESTVNGSVQSKPDKVYQEIAEKRCEDIIENMQKSSRINNKPKIEQFFITTLNIL